MTKRCKLLAWYRRQRSPSRRRRQIVNGLVIVGVVVLALSLLLVDVVPPGARTLSNLCGLRRAIHVYTRIHGRPPGTLADLPPETAALGTDAWGRPIAYRVESDGRVTLASKGSDGRRGSDPRLTDTFDPNVPADDLPSDAARRPARLWGRSSTRPGLTAATRGR